MTDQGTSIERLRTAVHGGGSSDVLGVAHEVGASAAQTGVPLHEVLDHVERACAPDPAPAGVVRATALAWADVTLADYADVSCDDPLTSLATAPYLRSRLAEVYRGAAARGRSVADTHALVVVELQRARHGNEIEQELRALEVAELLRTVFTADETIARPSPRRFAALVASERADDVTIRLVGLLLDRAGHRAARRWVERLPASVDDVAHVLVALSE